MSVMRVKKTKIVCPKNELMCGRSIVQMRKYFICQDSALYMFEFLVTDFC